MLEANLFIRKNRKGKNLYMSIKTNRAKLGDVSTGLFCKPQQWLGDRWCKESGKISNEDKIHNTRVNARIKEMIKEYQGAWDSLHKAGQKIIELHDLKSFLGGTHTALGKQLKRVTLPDAIDDYLAWYKMGHKQTDTVIAHLERLVLQLEALGYDRKTTLDQFSVDLGVQLVDSLNHVHWKSRRGEGKYGLSTKRRILGYWKLMFEFFFTKSAKLDYRPMLPPANPFREIRIEKQKDEKDTEKLRDIHFYSEAEIAKLETIKLKPAEHYIRNMLLLQIYTGLSVKDLINIDLHEKVENSINGRDWIKCTRLKSDVAYAIPVDDKVKNLIHYFKTTDRPDGRLSRWKRHTGTIQFSSTSGYTQRLIELSKVVGFKIHATHKARHTFAVNSLKKGFSMEALSLMLGHDQVTTTATFYGKVTQDKIDNELDLIEANMKLIEQNKRLMLGNDSEKTGTNN